MDKETERMKVELTANYYMGAHVNIIVLVIAILASFLVAIYSAFVAGQINIYGEIISEIIVFVALLYVLLGRGGTFKKRLKYLDSLIEKVENNQPLGTLQDIIDKAPS